MDFSIVALCFRYRGAGLFDSAHVYGLRNVVAARFLAVTIAAASEKAKRGRFGNDIRRYDAVAGVHE